MLQGKRAAPLQGKGTGTAVVVSLGYGQTPLLGRGTQACLHPQWVDDGGLPPPLCTTACLLGLQLDV